VDTKEPGGRPARTRFKSDSLIFNGFGTPGGGTLSAAAVGVRHIEMVAFLDGTTGLTHDLRGIPLDRVHSPFQLEVLLTWGEGFVPFACRSQPSAFCCAGLRPASFGIGYSSTSPGLSAV
jgi:hypothetical protein